MIRKIYWCCLAGTSLALLPFLFSCVTPSSYYITGVKRKPVVYEQVELYTTPPELYEVIGYVEGWNEWDGLIIREDEAEGGSIGELKKTAGEMGANGVVLTLIGTETLLIGGSDYPPNNYYVASGWAINVPREETLPDKKEPGGSDKEAGESFRFHIEPPESYEVLGDVSSRKECKNVDLHHLIDTKSSAIGKALDELKRKAITLGGNGLYVLDITRTHETERSDMIDAIFFGEDYGTVTAIRMFYVMSGQAIKVPGDDNP